MKFTKEQAIKELEAKIPTKDKDLDLGRTISEAVDNSIELIGDNSEMELSDFVEKVFKQVKTSIGLTHSENSKVASKLQEKIAELEKKVPPTAPTNPPVDTENEELKKIREEINALKQLREQEDNERKVSEKRTALKEKIAKEVKDSAWIDTILTKANITAELDVDAEAKDYVEMYNKTHVPPRSFTPKAAGGGQGEDTYMKDSIVAAKKLMTQKNAMMGGSPVSTETIK